MNCAYKLTAQTVLIYNVDVTTLLRVWERGRRMAKYLVLIALLFLTPALSKADTIWDYTSQLLDGADYHGGNPGPNCNCYLTGTVVEDSSFNVVSYSFTDGKTTLTNLNSTASIDPFNAPGQHRSNPFAIWNVMIQQGAIVFFTQGDGGVQNGDSVVDGTLVGSIDGDGEFHQGTWTEVSTPTPEPASFVVLLVGLATMAFFTRGRLERPSAI